MASVLLWRMLSCFLMLLSGLMGFWNRAGLKELKMSPDKSFRGEKATVSPPDGAQSNEEGTEWGSGGLWTTGGEM